MTAPSLASEITLQQLEGEPYPIFDVLREHAPVAWVPVLDGWLVTRRELCIEVMRDPVTFTVDDPRFSTAQVVGPSMLSLDGSEHSRHRDPFVFAFRAGAVRDQFTDAVHHLARRRVELIRPEGRAELRRGLAGPLAVEVMTEALQLVGTQPSTLLSWYDAIVAAVNQISAGDVPGGEGREAFAQLTKAVLDTVETGAGPLAAAATSLTLEEIASNAAVMLFGGIETAEGMTTNAFWHLLGDPMARAEVASDPSLLPQVVEESLRLEPAAARVDRYATIDHDLGGAQIRAGNLVIVSLTAANRDPAFFPDPHRFDWHRPNLRQHLTFAQGPHACIGIHLARLETLAALKAALELLPQLALQPSESIPPRGLVFRKPPRLVVTWDVL